MILIALTEELDAATRRAIIDVCIAAHQEPDFENLFIYAPTGGRHFLAYDGATLVSHASVSTRWLQPEGHPIMRTAYVDAVATLPAYRDRGMAALSCVNWRSIDDYAIACLETDRPGFMSDWGGRCGVARWLVAVSGVWFRRLSKKGNGAASAAHAAAQFGCRADD